MAPTLQQLGLDRLSADDRLAVAEAIWESVVQEIEHFPITEAQRRELERRLADSIVHPEAVTPLGRGLDPETACPRRRTVTE